MNAVNFFNRASSLLVNSIPRKKDFLAFVNRRRVNFGIDSRIPGLPFDWALSSIPNPDSLVVLMPARLMENKERDDRHPIFSRFTWHDKWPSSNVLAFIDPAIKKDQRLRGAWYMNPDHDVIEALSQFIREQADSQGIPYHRILIYGSSLGGFGAIGIASLIPGARAIAEACQIDFAGWLPEQVREVEEMITGPIEQYRLRFPEQVSVRSRIEKSRLIPPILLLTNPTETCYEQQKEFYEWLEASEIERIASPEIYVTNKVQGHQTLPPDELMFFLQP